MVIAGVAGWVVIGLLVGFIVSKMIDLHGDDPRLGIGVAIGGAIIAGIVYTVVSGVGITYFNVWSVLWAAAGAAVAVFGWHAVRSRSVSREPYTRRSSY